MWNNPYIVGIINAIMPGLGYLILRKREVFGLFILTGSVFALVAGYTYPFPAEYFVGAPGILWNLTWLFSAAGFGYDAYVLAKGKDI